MKKLNFKKTLLSLTLGLVMVLSLIPTTFNKLIPTKASEKNVYETPTTVDISGSFDSDSAKDHWTLSTSYNNDKDADSNSFNGIISTDLSTWDEGSMDKLEDWLEAWNTNHVYDENLTASTRELFLEVAQSHYDIPLNPLVPNFRLGETTDYMILTMMAGTTFTQYVDPSDKTKLSVQSVAREAYNTYTSKNVTLDQYSFYKISVWVKTEDNAVASITIGGDIEETAFSGISSVANNENKRTYYFYSFNDGTNTINFISETAPDAGTVEYDNLTYNKDGNIYVPDTTDPEYAESKANYTITDLEKTTTANRSGWLQYSIYVSTTTQAEINVGLSLGVSEAEKSPGSVYFDDLKIEKIQLLDFYTKAVANNITAVIDEREILNQQNTDNRNYTVVDNFETTHGWTLQNAPLDGTDLILVEESYHTGIENTFPQSNASGVNKMLSIVNHGANEITVNSTEINLSKNRYYRVSFWAYSAQSSATLKVHLVSKNASGTEKTVEDSTKPYIADRDKNDTTSINNFWVNYVFYVQVPAEKNVFAHLKLTIPASITINVDNFVVETVSKKEYTDTTNKKLDLKTEVKDEIITNGTFHTYDSVKESDYTNLLPPTNWTSTKKFDIYEYFADPTSDKVTTPLTIDDITLSADETEITYDGKIFKKADTTTTYNYNESGTDKILEKIILVEDKEFTYNSSKTAYTHSDYEDFEIASNVSAGIDISSQSYNSLKFSATTAESLTFKSSVIKLSTTGSLYIISANIQTDVSSVITLRLVDSEGKVYGTIANINTFGNVGWKTVKFYVGTGLETIELYLEIEYVDCVGTAEIKNVSALKTTSTSVLDNKLSKSHDELINDGIAIIDLKTETFIEHSTKLNNNTNLYDANLYTASEIEGKTSGIYGILDTTDPHENFSSIKAKDADVSPYVLVIKNADGQSTELKATKKFTVAKSKYMLITVVAKVEGLTEGKSATINFPGLNKSFNVTSGEYTEFKLYIDNKDNENATSVDYSFALLDSAETLIVDSISIESPSNLDDVKSEYKDGDTDTVKFVTTTETDKDDTTDKEDDTNADDLDAEDENNTLEIFLAILSSLLLVASIVFAIVFTRIKKLKKPRHKVQRSKVSETDDGQKGFI